MNFIYSLSALLLCSLTAMAQQPPFRVVRGIVRDSATGEPLPYTSISLTRNGLNTLSNESGRFLFKIPAHARHDTIYISHIGYRAMTFTTGPADTTTRVIALDRNPINLPDITVSHSDAMGILRKAIGKISDNYPSSPYKLTGFYRVTSGEGKAIIEVTEGLFTIFSPDNQRVNNEFRLIKARADRDLVAFNGSSYQFGRKPRSLMNFDIVSNLHASPFLGDKRITEHDFHLAGLIEFDGRTAYEVRFDEKEGINESLYKGRIIIDTATYAFVFFEYERSPRGLPYMKPESYPMDPDMHALMQDKSVTVTYKQFGNRYYLNHVHTISHFHVHNDGYHNFDINPIEPRTNYLITRIDTGAAAFTKEGELVRNDDLIELQIGRTTYGNTDFWEQYNSIEPDFNIDSARAVIRRQNTAYARDHHIRFE